MKPHMKVIRGNKSLCVPVSESIVDSVSRRGAVCRVRVSRPSAELDVWESCSLISPHRQQKQEFKHVEMKMYVKMHLYQYDVLRSL